MEAYEMRAYEVLGFWTVVLIRVWQREDGVLERSLIYRGDHVPMDETDPVIRAELLLHQVMQDLEWSHQVESEVLPITGASMSH